MKRRDLLATGGGLLAGLAGCTAGGAPSGASTPESRGLVLPSLDVAGSPGGQVALRPPGRVALLDFFATWCAPCKPEMAHLRAVRDRYDTDTLHVVSITAESDEPAIRDFWRTYDGTWPVVRDVDLEATRAYDVTGIPTILVLTPDGEPTLRHVGLAGEDRLVEGVDAALATD